MPSDAEVKAGMEAITALTAEWQTKYGTTLPSLEAEAVAVLEAAEAVRAGSSPEEPAEPITEERQRILDALDVQEMWDEFNDATIANVYATCPYRLKDGSLGAYGPNTCHGGCREEPECVTGGPFEERDEMEAVRDYLVGIVSSAVPPSQEPPT